MHAKLLLALVLAIPAAGQLPTELANIPLAPRCSGVQVQGPDSKHETVFPPARNFSLRRDSFCSQYSFSGWEKPLVIHLGEGAEEYVHLIEQAVGVWNLALDAFSDSSTEAIKITASRPRNFSLSAGFWAGRAQAREYANDGQSTIYFKPGGFEMGSAGFSQIRRDRYDRMAESDMYIDTSIQERYPSNRFVASQLVFDIDGTNGIFMFVDILYGTILHELGHALGLLHVPVSGNVMSYNYLPRMIDIWNAPAQAYFIAAAMGGFYDQSMDGSFVLQMDKVNELGVVGPDSALNRLVDMSTNSISLGAQDKMMLMCVYDFDDWVD